MSSSTMLRFSQVQRLLLLLAAVFWHQAFISPVSGYRLHKKSAITELPSACPSQEVHLQRYGQHASGHNESSPVSLLLPNNVKLRGIEVREESDVNVPLAGGRHCIDNGAGDDQTTLSGQPHESSLCPWFWQINYDPKRLPAALPEAKCKCDQPLLPEAGRCEELLYKIKTLKYEDNCGSFKEHEELISVACVAVRRPTVDVSSGSNMEVEYRVPIVVKRNRGAAGTSGFKGGQSDSGGDFPY